MVTVRRLGEGDGLLWRSAVESILSAEQRENELIDLEDADQAVCDDRSYILIAQNAKGEPVGLITGYRFPDLVAGGQLVYFYDIEVLQAKRQQGVGKQLLQAMIEACDNDDVDLIWAGTEADNHAARKLFESTHGALEGESYVEYEWELEED